MSWNIVYQDTFGSAALNWTAPTTNSNGDSFDGSTNDRTLVGYRVYGKRSTDFVYTVLATVLAPTTSTTVTGLTSGSWTFYVVAYDADGDESDASYGDATVTVP